MDKEDKPVEAEKKLPPRVEEIIEIARVVGGLENIGLPKQLVFKAAVMALYDHVRLD